MMIATNIRPKTAVKRIHDDEALTSQSVSTDSITATNETKTLKMAQAPSSLDPRSAPGG